MKNLAILLKNLISLCLIYCCIISPFTPVLSTYSPTFGIIKVQAESAWARVLNENTALYADPNCTLKKFYLPRTYFVRIVEMGEESTRITYMDNSGLLPLREGYVKTCELYSFDGTPAAPYPQVTVELTADEILFADSNKQYPKTVLTAGATAVFYGTLQIDNENFCYVYSSGYVGYVRKSAFKSFTVPDHPLPIVTEEPPQNSADSPNSSEFATQSSATASNDLKIDSTMRIVIIVAVAVTCISVIYLLFRPRYSDSMRLAVWKDDEE